MIKFQTYYNRTHKDEGIEFDPNSSLTDQSFRLETDIDYLISNMAGQNRTPLYGIQERATFEDWANEMALVKRRFMNLSEDQKQRFGNAQNFLKWCADPNNYVEELPTIQEEQRLYKNKKSEQEYQERKTESLAKKIAGAIKGE